MTRVKPDPEGSPTAAPGCDGGIPDAVITEDLPCTAAAGVLGKREEILQVGPLPRSNVERVSHGLL